MATRCLDSNCLRSIRRRVIVAAKSSRSPSGNSANSNIQERQYRCPPSCRFFGHSPSLRSGSFCWTFSAYLRPPRQSLGVSNPGEAPHPRGQWFPCRGSICKAPRLHREPPGHGVELEFLGDHLASCTSVGLLAYVLGLSNEGSQGEPC